MLRGLFGRLVQWWCRPYRIYSPDGELYLVRYVLFRTGPFGVFIHHIVLSDLDRDLHDHPWNFWAMVLWGPGYIEHQPTGKVWCPRWRLRHKYAWERHRVELVQDLVSGCPQGVWTLFVRQRRTREWGFDTPEGWVPHHQYRREGRTTV